MAHTKRHLILAVIGGILLMYPVCSFSQTQNYQAQDRSDKMLLASPGSPNLIRLPATVEVEDNVVEENNIWDKYTFSLFPEEGETGDMLNISTTHHKKGKINKKAVIASAVMLGGTVALVLSAEDDDGIRGIIRPDEGSYSFLSNAEKSAKGSGVKVAVVDNGVIQTSVSLDTVSGSQTVNLGTAGVGGSNAVVAGCNFVTSNTCMQDNNSDSLPDGDTVNKGTTTDTGFGMDHGTRVAAIINGIVPESELISARALAADSNGFTDTRMANALQFSADRGAKVINNSWGEPGDGFDLADLVADSSAASNYIGAGLGTNDDWIAAVKNFIPNNASTNLPLMVFAAGNDAEAHPNPIAGLYLLGSSVSYLKSHWLVTVAIQVNSGGTYSIYSGGPTWAPGSNKCGLVEDNCIGLVANSTSFAAAEASGIAAKLISSGLTTEQAKARMLVIARDTLAKSTYIPGSGNTASAEIGVGIITDPQNLLNPLGNVLVIPTRNLPNGQSTIPWNKNLMGASSLRFSSAFGNALAYTPIQFTVMDNGGDVNGELGSASFFLPLAERMYTPIPAFSHEKAFSTFGQTLFKYTQELAPHVEISFNDIQPGTDANTTMGNAQMLSAATQGTLSDKQISLTVKEQDTAYTMNHHVPAHKAFGLGAIAKTGDLYGLGQDSFSNPYLGFSEEGNSLILHHTLDDITAMHFGIFQEKGKGDNTQVNTLVSEIVYDLPSDLMLGIQNGLMIEKDTFLGSKAGGIFAIQPNTPTWFSTVEGKKGLWDTVDIYGAYHTGITTVKPAEISLFSHFSPIVTNGFSAGISKTGLIKKKDMLRLGITQPLRVVSGQVEFWQYGSAHLAPEGKELDYEATYRAPMHGDAKLELGALYRTQPGHDPAAKSEGLLMLNYKLPF